MTGVGKSTGTVRPVGYLGSSGPIDRLPPEPRMKTVIWAESSVIEVYIFRPITSRSFSSSNPKSKERSFLQVIEGCELPPWFLSLSEDFRGFSGTGWGDPVSNDVQVSLFT